jgi:hypothetical protein
MPDSVRPGCPEGRVEGKGPTPPGPRARPQGNDPEVRSDFTSSESRIPGKRHGRLESA